MALRLARKSVPSIESTCRPGKIGAVAARHPQVREGLDQARDVAARRLHFDRNRDRVAVVFDEEEDR
jgi:hypothetical protein